MPAERPPPPGTGYRTTNQDTFVATVTALDRRTTSLLAADINADTIVFVSLWDEIELILQMDLSNRRHVTCADLDQLIERARDLDEDLCNKLIATQSFLARGGRSVLLAPPDYVSLEPGCCRGLFITNT